MIRFKVWPDCEARVKCRLESHTHWTWLMDLVMFLTSFSICFHQSLFLISFFPKKKRDEKFLPFSLCMWSGLINLSRGICSIEIIIDFFALSGVSDVCLNTHAKHKQDLAYLLPRPPDNQIWRNLCDEWLLPGKTFLFSLLSRLGLAMRSKHLWRPIESHLTSTNMLWDSWGVEGQRRDKFMLMGLRQTISITPRLKLAIIAS